MWNIGVDVGGTNIKFGIIDENGGILSQEKVRTEPDRGPQAIIDSIIAGIGAIMAKASLRPQAVNSIGLGVPGTADTKNGIVVYAPNLFWTNVEIVKTIGATFPIPVFIAQDTRAAAWAEYIAGAGKGLRSVASVTLGTGIGCGMVLDGKIFNGGLNTAGEFGHQIVELDGRPCNCGRHGCLEAHVGGLAIVREARETIPGICTLLNKNLLDIEVHDVYKLAQSGNAYALRLTDRVVKYIGMGLVNLINLNSVELISISGGISNAPDHLLLNPLIEFVRARAYQSVAGQVRIRRSSLGEDAPLIGVGLLYRENLNEKLF